MEKSLAYDLDALAVDVFELVDTDVTVESLTGGHLMTEVAASCRCSCCCFLDVVWCSGSCATEFGQAVAYPNVAETVAG